MKKSFKLFLLASCLCPLALLSACTPPEKYLISALSSDPTLGRVQGIINEELEEGSKITLTAKENKASTNPFICWIKDNSTFVSSDTTLNLTYNASTAGNYTALFEETSQEKMLFAALSKIEFKPVGYASVNVEISYSMINSGSSDYAMFYSNNCSTQDAVNTNFKSLLYFGSAGISNEYKFKIKLDGNNQSSPFETEIQLSNIIDRSSFDESGVCIASQVVEGFNATLTLTFEKLKYSMYH